MCRHVGVHVWHFVRRRRNLYTDSVLVLEASQFFIFPLHYRLPRHCLHISFRSRQRKLFLVFTSRVTNQPIYPNYTVGISCVLFRISSGCVLRKIHQEECPVSVTRYCTNLYCAPHSRLFLVSHVIVNPSDSSNIVLANFECADHISESQHHVAPVN